MATFGPKPRDSASLYVEIYNDPQQRFGVQNARTVRGKSKQTLTSRPSEDGRRKRLAPVYRGANELTEDEITRNKLIEQRYYQENEEVTAQSLPNDDQLGKPKFIVSLATKNIATTWMLITNSWAVVVWSVLQFWAGLMSSLFFGLTAAVTYTYFGDIISAVAMWFGYTEPNLMSLGFWGLVTAAAIGWISLLIGAMHAKIWLLHPLFGRGGAVKTGTFLLAGVLYSIPLLNMIPWICLWTWTVKIYPK